MSLAANLATMADTPFITLEKITARLGDRWLLADTDWQILTGQHWAVVGPNGSGKTTLARMLAGEVPVVQGRIRRHYQNGPTAAQAREPMAIVSSEQYHRLHERERQRDTMRHFSGRISEYTPAGELLENAIKERGAQAKTWFWPKAIETLALAEILAKPLTALTSSEMRKLLLARALALNPRMLILDEPFNGLDAPSRNRLNDLLSELAAAGTQMVLIVHRLAEMPEFCDHVLQLDRGRVVWQGERSYFDPDRMSPPKDLPTEATSLHTNAAHHDNGGAPLIRMRNVTVRYGRFTVLRDVNWVVRPNEHWAVTGPNGAGKTTLLKLITGDQLQAYANDITLFGRPRGSGESVWEVKRRIGYVGDDVQARYQRSMSAFDVVCSGFFDSVGLYRHCSPEQRETARWWCRKLALEDIAGSPIKRLSFGQQRLILIARAMVKSPCLLILDEPCNGLDPANRRRVLEMLARIADQEETSLLYVTHRPDEIPAVITHRLYMDRGKVVRQSP